MYKNFSKAQRYHGTAEKSEKVMPIPAKIIQSVQLARNTDQPPAIQTAVALAEHEAKTSDAPEEDVKLKTEHIQEVIEMSQVFKE